MANAQLISLIRSCKCLGSVYVRLEDAMDELDLDVQQGTAALANLTGLGLLLSPPPPIVWHQETTSLIPWMPTGMDIPSVAHSSADIIRSVAVQTLLPMLRDLKLRTGVRSYLPLTAELLDLLQERFDCCASLMVSLNYLLNNTDIKITPAGKCPPLPGGLKVYMICQQVNAVAALTVPELNTLSARVERYVARRLMRRARRVAIRADATRGPVGNALAMVIQPQEEAAAAAAKTRFENS